MGQDSLGLLGLADKRELLYYNSIYFTLKEKNVRSCENSCPNSVFIFKMVTERIVAYTA